MRMSCNGCRVLRKGCSENCTIRPCLDWIKCPHSQAYATVFLAKFYGRAGLINLINSGPPHLRPAIFRSLLYEACGRIVNPVYGSVGLMWSGSWNLCQTAVEEVLNGAPITQIAAENQIGPPLKAYDIRHVNKKDSDLNRVRTRCRFKRAGKKSKPVRVSAGEVDGSPSHESSLSHQSDVNRAKEPGSDSGRRADDGLIELDLGLGLEPFKGHLKPKEIEMKIDVGSAEDEAGFCKMELGLDYTALCDQF